MLRIRAAGKRRTERNKLPIRSNELLDPVMLTRARHKDVIHSRDLSPLVTFNPLVEIETQAILHITPCIEHSNWTNAGQEIITFYPLYVTRNLTARIGFSENPPGIVQQKEDPKCYRNYGGPQKHPRSSASHQKE